MPSSYLLFQASISHEAEDETKEDKTNVLPNSKLWLQMELKD